MDNVLLAFLLTLLSGLATGIGGLITLFTKRSNNRFLSISMGFSAGVMIYVSMIELFPEANALLGGMYGEKTGSLYTVLSFFAGMFLIALIDKFIPEDENPHEMASCPLPAVQNGKTQNLKRTGVMTAVAIAIHNFPEGIATFMAAMQDPRLGVPIAVAIAVHNIPEGIAVSVPVYYATGSRAKAFRLSFLSGLAEPVGALLAWLVLMPFLTDTLFGLIFAGVAGIMVFISVDQLLPSARKYGEHHVSIYGLIVGMMIMAVSLLLFI